MIPDEINIIKAIRFFDAHIIGSAVLETGVIIHMKDDGSAIGDDGKTYYTVSQDDENGNCDILGYSSDIVAPIDDTVESSLVF